MTWLTIDTFARKLAALQVFDADGEEKTNVPGSVFDTKMSNTEVKIAKLTEGAAVFDVPIENIDTGRDQQSYKGMGWREIADRYADRWLDR